VAGQVVARDGLATACLLVLASLGYTPGAGTQAAQIVVDRPKGWVRRAKEADVQSGREVSKHARI
jgi:hypothetical protein